MIGGGLLEIRHVKYLESCACHLVRMLGSFLSNTLIATYASRRGCVLRGEQVLEIKGDLELHRSCHGAPVLNNSCPSHTHCSVKLPRVSTRQKEAHLTLGLIFGSSLPTHISWPSRNLSHTMQIWPPNNHGKLTPGPGGNKMVLSWPHTEGSSHHLPRGSC